MLPDQTLALDEAHDLLERLADKCSDEDGEKLVAVMQTLVHHETTQKKLLDLVDRLRVRRLARRGPWDFEAEDAFLWLNGFPTSVAEEERFWEHRRTR